MPTADRLIRLYLETSYDVRMHGGRRIALRIGDQVPGALRALYADDAFATIITACNPHSQPLDARSNRVRQRRLRDELEQLRAPLLAAVGHLRAERWREPALCVTGLDAATIDCLARRHAQNAVVVLATHARLRIVRDDWRPIVAPHAWIDFA